jgi:hypothetical protein
LWDRQFPTLFKCQRDAQSKNSQNQSINEKSFHGCFFAASKPKQSRIVTPEQFESGRLKLGVILDANPRTKSPTLEPSPPLSIAANSFPEPRWTKCLQNFEPCQTATRSKYKNNENSLGKRAAHRAGELLK